MAHCALFHGTDPKEDTSLITTILTSSSLGLTVIYPAYPHNLHFLPPPLIFIQQSHSKWRLGLVLGEHLLKKNYSAMAN